MAFSLDELHDTPDTLLKGQHTGVEAKSRMLRHLKRSTDSREFLYLTTSGTGVKPLDIAAFAFLQGCGDIYFNKVLGSNDVTCQLAIFVCWGDECCEGDDPCVDKELAYFGDATDVFPTILCGETESGIYARTDIIAVKDAAEQTTLMQLALHAQGNGTFARAAEACEPNHQSTLVEQSLLVLACHHAVIYGKDVSVGHLYQIIENRDEDDA